MGVELKSADVSVAASVTSCAWVDASIVARTRTKTKADRRMPVRIDGRGGEK